jgi:hypothetical protein
VATPPARGRGNTRADPKRKGKGIEVGREYVVFCLDQFEYGQEGFGWFLHEADYLLLSVAQHVEEGNITVTEALEWLEPYLSDAHIRERIPFLKEGWSFEDAQKWERIFDKDSPDFPVYEDVIEDLPITHIFQDRAYDLAIDADIPDVGYLGFSGSTGPIFSVESLEALERLRKAVAGKYKIVVKEDLDEYVPSPAPSPEEARRFIERHRG